MNKKPKITGIVVKEEQAFFYVITFTNADAIYEVLYYYSLSLQT